MSVPSHMPLEQRLLLVGLVLHFARLAGAREIAAESCTQTAVQMAIDAAAAGDTVTVPSGSCTWSATVHVNNNINLAGNNAIIRREGPGTQLLSFASTGELSGFHFIVSGQSDNWNGDVLGFANAPRIHHNTFESSTAKWMIKGQGEPTTLIDHNTFRGDAHVMHLYSGGDSDFDSKAPYGTDQWVFIEDNNFELNDSYGSTSWAAVDYDSGGLVVFRHNTLNNSFFEQHDRCRSGLTSARAFEVYNNHFSKDSTGWKAIDLASGDGVAFGNTFGPNWSVPIGIYKSRDACALPASEVPGAIEPMYIWNNTQQDKEVELVCTSTSSACSEMTWIDGQARPDYQPFTYPHPRQNAVRTSAPVAPTSLQVTL